MLGHSNHAALDAATNDLVPVMDPRQFGAWELARAWLARLDR
ncbi:MAG: hypothetical protein AVDCRST_MAG73-2035 [uncultured Thermomicrobiales bacterium]|uniref:Uncharacterized protein n=1 Tax=uncultured Thermomicrobiales bacterium TaxID=1645740 RepID=A0A6J4U6Z1_9BACT|nr:MAG: hypothetical protein AVDCRST_MAG73-2035 [uncultured Thermomicrobiales bacterium]